MNFSLTRNFSVFAASDVYWACAFETCDSFPYICDASFSGGLVDHRQPAKTCVSHIMRPIHE